MKIQAGKTYLTAGEYVVEIMEHDDQLHATRRTSAGLCGGKTIDQCWSKPYGWYYNDNGLMTGISKEWDRKLNITEELPFSLPELPKGYEWAGGFPQYRIPNAGEYFCAKNTNGTLTGEAVQCFSIVGLFGSDKRRLIVSKAVPSEPQTSELPAEPSVVSEKPPIDPGKGYRLIDKIIDKPQEGDQIYNESFKKWQKREIGYINKPYGGWSFYRRALPTAEQADNIASQKVLYYKPSFRDNTLFIKRVGNKLGFVYASDLNPNLRYNWETSDEREVREGRWVEITQEEVDKILAALSVVPTEPQKNNLGSQPILPELSGDFKFLLSNGEPVFRKPNDDEYFVKYNYATKKYGPIVKSKNFHVPFGADERRYIVVPTAPEKIVITNNKPDPGEGYRLIDKSVDKPQEGDQIYVNGKWVNRFCYNSLFEKNNHCFYRRAITTEQPNKSTLTPSESEDWVEITNLDHVDRADIDQWSKDGLNWIPTIDITDKMSLRKCRERFGKDVKYRCLRKYVPTVPSEQPIGTAIANNTDPFTAGIVKGKSYKVFEKICKYGVNYFVIHNEFGKTKEYHVDHFDTFLESDISLSDNIVSGVDSTKEEEVVMKKETAIKVANSVTRFAGRWGFKAANYWLFEPAVSMGRPIVKSIRYAVFLGTLGSAIYGYNHPEVVKNAIKSCIPKITIEAPEILNG